MSECSEARLAANRLNAQKSTGPVTAEGKERSRRNAVTHGLCTVAFEIPGQDDDALAVRLGDWQAELNPAHRAAQSYLILQAVRRSARLDRLDTVYHARVAGLARNAQKAAKEERMKDVELYAEMLIEGRCDVAVRRLRLTPEGCAYLINEWEAMRPALQPPPQWDDADDRRVVQLMGAYTTIRAKTPSPIGLGTMAITEHREMAFKLKRNQNPDILMWNQRYKNPQEHQDDREAVEFLAEKAERYRVWLSELIDKYTGELREEKARLDAIEAIEAAEAPYRAMFDASDEGKLHHRYEMDAERSLLRCLKEVREQNKADGVSTQADRTEDIMNLPPATTPAQSAPRPARNEPTPRASTSPPDRPATPPGAGYAFVPVNMTRDPGAKNQR